MMCSHGRRRRYACTLILALASLVSATIGVLADDIPTVRIGVITPRDIMGPEYSWGGTLEQLSRALPQYRFVMEVFDRDRSRDAVENQKVDFIIGNPAQYVEMEADFGISRIATVEFANGPAPSSAIGSLIFTRSDRTDIKTLDDVRGKRVVAIESVLFGGFSLGWLELQKRGIDPFRDTQSLEFVGEPVEKVFAAVADGSADVGIARTCYFERLVAAGEITASEFAAVEGETPQRLGCLTSTPLYPDWPFSKLSHTSDALAKQVAQALLAMPPDENGVSWTIPVDYQPVQSVFRTLKIGPYADLGPRDPWQILSDNWQWVAAALLGLAWVLVSLARVQYLVRLRTQQLNDAHLMARRERENLEHAARLSLMGEMASSLAHEISQPLAAIVNYARGCQRRMSSGTRIEEIEPGMAQIVVQAERATSIVRRMRDFVRKRPPVVAPVRIREILEETLEFFRPLAERQGVLLIYEAPDVLPVVNVDRIQIEEVLLNLLQNAVDACKGGDVREVSITLSVETESVLISVSDTGPGMSEETRSRLFEAFYTTKPEGLGLGLSLSRSIVEAHGGRLIGENLDAGGTQMSFSLPVSQE